MRRHQRSGKGRRVSGKVFRLTALCVSLVLAAQISSLNRVTLMRRAVSGIVAPICRLAGYAGEPEEREHWRKILQSVFSVALPLTVFAKEGEDKEASALNDPVYDRYLSSELLYDGGGVTLPEMDKSENVPTTEQDDSENMSTTEPGDQAAEETIETHLPTVITGKCYTKLQLQNFNYLVEQLYFVHSSTCVYPSQLDVDTLLSKNLTIDRQTAGPQILIHHTHGTEGFADTEEGNGKTILEVGDYLTELLTGYGYTVIHDRSIYPYDTAYSEAQVRVKKILAENPTIQLVIDLHRDATASQVHRIVTVNGETMAPLMFFNGMCQTADGPIDYLSNPYLEDNLALSLQMKLIAEAYYPGLTRPNFLKAYQYNQHLLPRYTLIEAGFDTNTFEEVCRSMVPLANILDAVLSNPEAVVLAGE